MRRLLPLILCLSALVLVACGSDDASGGGDQEFSFSAAETAKATREHDAAKVDMVVEMSGAGLPMPVSLKADGTTGIKKPAMDVTFDVGSLLQLAGAPDAGDGKLRVLFTDGKLWVDPPEVEQVKLPGGATWVTADVNQLLKAVGVDVNAFKQFLNVTPDQQITMLQAAGDLEEVGTEELDGVETTHLSGTVTVKQIIEQLPAEQKAAAEKALKDLEKLAGGEEAAKQLDAPQKVDYWIGEDKLIRRLVQTTEIPAQQGVPGAKLKITMNLSDYGTKLDIAPPADDETYDATKDLEQALKSIPSAATVPNVTG